MISGVLGPRHFFRSTHMDAKSAKAEGQINRRQTRVCYKSLTHISWQADWLVIETENLKDCHSSSRFCSKDFGWLN